MIIILSVGWMRTEEHSKWQIETTNHCQTPLNKLQIKAVYWTLDNFPLLSCPGRTDNSLNIKWNHTKPRLETTNQKNVNITLIMFFSRGATGHPCTVCNWWFCSILPSTIGVHNFEPYQNFGLTQVPLISMNHHEVPYFNGTFVLYNLDHFWWWIITPAPQFLSLWAYVPLHSYGSIIWNHSLNLWHVFAELYWSTMDHFFCAPSNWTNFSSPAYLLPARYACQPSDSNFLLLVSTMVDSLDMKRAIFWRMPGPECNSLGGFRHTHMMYINICIIYLHQKNTCVCMYACMYVCMYVCLIAGGDSIQKIYEYPMILPINKKTKCI